MIVIILLCIYRCFIISPSHNPLGAYSTTLAHYVTVGHWALMGAFFWSAIKHECCTQPAETVQEKDGVETAEVFSVDEAVSGPKEDNTAGIPTEPEEAASALKKDHDEATETHQGVAKAAMEVQPQNMEVLVASVQEEVTLMMDLLAHEIMRKEVHLRSPVEQSLVNRWTALQ